MQAEGYTGWVRLEGERVVIRKKLLYGATKGEKSIPIAAISAVQFKPAGGLNNGFIQFAYSGAKECTGGVFAATKDENSVVFTGRQEAAFAALRDEVLRRQSAGQAQSAAPATASAADEIERFAALREKGLLTDEEFQAKKRQLLGL